MIRINSGENYNVNFPNMFHSLLTFELTVFFFEVINNTQCKLLFKLFYTRFILTLSYCEQIRLIRTKKYIFKIQSYKIQRNKTTGLIDH